MKAGDVLKVKVLEVDLQRKRIALTMKLDAPPAREQAEQAGHDRQPRSNAPQAAAQSREAQSNGAMAEAWAQALKRR